jgi:hypothetical protein
VAAKLTKRILQSIAGVLGLFILIVGSYIAYLTATYIDETTVTGAAHGYVIGQSKREAYDVARKQFVSRKIYGLHVFEPFESFKPDEVYWAPLESNDTWTLFMSEPHSFFDTLRLRFSDGKLEQIHRHRQYFELP